MAVWMMVLRKVGWVVCSCVGVGAEHAETMWRAGCGAAASRLQRRVMEGRPSPSMVGGWRGLTESDGTREYDVGSRVGW